ncbi:uncharacterized protein LOC142986537 [Anticarsia gemmatalis]|uniref:uncharacterized protein LOC142986537 n=1 Tax=Anticarsia gemmatalis TaxID=129554 RepID=UPI003F76863A
MPFSKPGVVIDLGSYCCKAGFACDNHPVSIFRTVVGRPKNRVGFYGKVPYDVFIGDEAESHDDYELYSPVVHGKIVHWENMERVWHHVFYKELKVAPEERAVILASASKTSIEDKIKCCEIFFETLNAPALSVQALGVLALYGSGFTTGISVDLGYDSTDIDPVYEGGLLRYAHMDTNFSGRDFSEHLTNKLESKGFDLGPAPYKVIQDIKQQAMFLTPCSEMEYNQVFNQVKYVLPDGKEIDISEEAHCTPEILFSPKELVGVDTNILPLHEAVITAARKCDSELHTELLGGVVISGGLSSIPGLSQRLVNEIEGYFNKAANVVDSPESYCVAWLGAAIFAGMSDVKKVWVLKKQFEEYGERIVRNKFL